jgi:penicillin G amidase
MCLKAHLNPDVQDFYRERVDESGRFVEFCGTQEEMQVVEETIRVRSGAPVPLRVRITRHGPLAEGIMGLEKGAEPLAFCWTGLNPANTSIAAFLGLNNAHDWESFRAAVRLCTAAPVNFGYADAQGNFGFHSAGMVPIRARGNGSAPAAGWTGEHEWTGYIPFDELPHAFNPAEGYLILISTAPPDPEYPYLLTTDWVEPYRRERIREFITSKMNLSVEDHAALQADTISLFARRALPVMLPLAASKDEPTRAALALLKDWDYDACGGSAAAAIFCAWTLELPRALLKEELNHDLLASYEGWPSWTCRFMLNVLEGKTGAQCDPAKAVQRSLEKAVSVLRSRMGNDPRFWRWDGVHRAVFPHSPLNTQRWLRRFFSRSVPAAGDWSTVNLGGILSSAPFDQRNMPDTGKLLTSPNPVEGSSMPERSVGIFWHGAEITCVTGPPIVTAPCVSTGTAWSATRPAPCFLSPRAPREPGVRKSTLNN